MTPPKTGHSREACLALDASDPLAFTRARFSLPDGVLYLDGNSLGALPVATAARLQDAVQSEWGSRLIRAWNDADWVNIAQRVGARIAPLLGAQPNEVIAADSTSINLYKLLGGALQLAQQSDPTRKVILSEHGNFPTDLYMVEGLNRLAGDRYTLQLVERHEVANALDPSVAVALITQTDYCTGELHPMAALNRKAKSVGARIVWDLSHSAGAFPLALNADGTEFAVGCGYKYLNGGPGAPAYVYVAQSSQAQFPAVLSGWFGHATPFAFSSSYAPAAGIEKLQCGTPSVLAMQALDCGVATFDGVDMRQLRQKSLALSDLFWSLLDTHCDEYGFNCVSPREHARRGSQLSFAHDHAYAIMQALISRGVIGDFRQPNLLRFGFTPLYTRYVDIWDAVVTLSEVMATNAWQSPQFHQRHKVT